MINYSVASRLDYCNNLLYGASAYLISQLQLCQNNAARVLSLCRKFDHITPVAKAQHWLPVEQRIEYKMLLPTNKAFHGKALHTSPSCCLYIHQTGDCHQRPKIFSQFLGAGWKGLADAVRVLLHRSGIFYLHLLKVPLLSTLSRAAWIPTCLTWHILQSIGS